MSRYLVLWESNRSQWPSDAKEAAKLLSDSKDWVQQNIDKGLITSWGSFMVGSRGYAVMEGSPAQVYSAIRKLSPYYNNEIHEVLSISELNET